MMWHGYAGWGGGWAMAIDAIFWVLFLGIALALAYRIGRSAGQGRPTAGASGLGILEERYARGEIQRDEYLQKKRDLLGSGAA